MNSRKDNLIADIKACSSKKGKERAAQYYLYLVGLYIIFVFNEFIKRPVDFLALVLIIAGLPLINQNNIKSLRATLSHSVAAKVVVWSLVVMSALFILATLKQLPKYYGLIAFGAQYGVHIGLAAMALLVIPLNNKTTNFLFNCLLLALFAIVLTDAGFYVWDAKEKIEISIDHSHRWFGDGYVFLTPFLMAKILSYQGNALGQKPFNFALLEQCALLLLVVILASGTGSRSTYVLLALQLLFFTIFLGTQYRIRLIPMALFFLLGVIFFKNYSSFFSATLVDEAFARGFRIWDRVRFAWTPGVELMLEKPLMGHGFGAGIWNARFSLLQESSRQAIINYGGPHNWFLSAGFYGGILGVLSQITFSCGLITLLLDFPKNFNKLNGDVRIVNKVPYLLYGALGAFLSFYLLRGLFESPIYKYLSVILMLGLIINATKLNYEHTI